MEQFDFLVIGSGIAGLTYAHEVSKYGTVAILSKRELEYTATAWAQGGIAAVNINKHIEETSSDDDNFAFHIEDTLKAGDGLCNKEIVELVVREAPEAINKLLSIGVKFDKDRSTGDFHLHQEGGHSRRRIYHNADATGWEIQRALIKATKSNKNIKFFINAHAVDLITNNKILNKPSNVADNFTLGAYVLLESGEIQIIKAKKILVATGGAGKVYLYTSNPDIASGDGIAMCYRAGCRVANMEFFQFHPTCLYHPMAKSFLISEALRGEGAKLLTQKKLPFMHKYHKLNELAPRDIVARAIDCEMKASGDDFVYLDITHRGADFIKEHFPNIYEKCLTFGFDLTKQPIPVVPAAHYCCGGVMVDENGRTDIKNLFAAGECTNSGLHGANRLASNSLLEGVVFALRAAKSSIEELKDASVILNREQAVNIPDWRCTNTLKSDEHVIITQNWDEIRRFMWNYVGIVRSDRRLERALRRSEMIEVEINKYYFDFDVTPDLLELRNLSLVANLVIKSAMVRKESRGLHYTIDFPDKNEDFLKDTIIRMS